MLFEWDSSAWLMTLALSASEGGGCRAFWCLTACGKWLSPWCSTVLDGRAYPDGTWSPRQQHLQVVQLLQLLHSPIISPAEGTFADICYEHRVCCVLEQAGRECESIKHPARTDYLEKPQSVLATPLPLSGWRLCPFY